MALKILIKKLFSPFEFLIKRHQRSRLRQIMRGYRLLKESGQMDKIALVKQALTEHCLGLKRNHFSALIMGAGKDFSELITRQYLLVRFGGLDLNRALVRASVDEKGKVIFPMPRQWRAVLMEHDFKIAHFRSAILWQFYVFAFLFYGMLQIVRIAVTGLFDQSTINTNCKSYAFFMDLSSGNLPKINSGSHSYDVVSWYLQWPGRNAEIEEIRHSVADASPVVVGNITVQAQQAPLPSLADRGVIVKYLLWGLRASLIALFDCFRGRWWHALLLNQAPMAAQARFLPGSSLAREYYFHNSGWIYRPLWSYEAERKGSSILLYFYSTNCEGFKRPDGYPPMSYGWKAMNWPNYIVWDEYQADFVRRAVGDEANITVAGPIWFQSSCDDMPSIDKTGVAVFDVTPFRSSWYCLLGMDNEFYVPTVANPFLEDVNSVTQQSGVLMLWKRKRNVGRIAHSEYRHLINQLEERSNVVLIDPDISANRVIESSFAVISMPYTSTALIAKEMGKPSIYYDPSGKLQKDDRAAHGVEIINNKEDLSEWVKTFLA
ncbi:polysaccharide biosynthesis PFTS motif protein [Chlorobium phaeovibrioides]|uniref:polysaccharide biosynthesis PFTS motif protein n=1 Tax=Chlorobium phaeovibrioides TaxID=1094 RepID=UPI000F83F4FF|nr:polysaccharide biosynthesis PFTS motif protein [Chlorobium phaeovibrioides]RTY34214.1 polysaccharide biosynthesis PFTS motif protein [Chlorobium phaeovibrioides]